MLPLNKKNLILAFLSSFTLTVLMPTLAPGFRLMYFVPFLIILFYQKSFSTSLWIAFFCGLFIDLLSSQSPFGFYACNYTITSAIVFHQKRNFFADHLTTLPIMTFFFSCVLTLLQVFFLIIFGTRVSLSIQWLFLDLLLMPIFDALFALIWFILIPMSFQKKSHRRAL